MVEIGIYQLRRLLVRAQRGYLDQAIDDRSRKLMEIALENGADDVTESGEYFELTCTRKPTLGYRSVGFAEHRSRTKEVTRVPVPRFEVDAETAISVMKLSKSSKITTMFNR